MITYILLNIIIINIQVVCNDKISKEEAAFHILTTLINLIFAKNSKEQNVFKILQSQIPSLCYLFYKEEIFTESFIIEKLCKRSIDFKNFFYAKEAEDNFIDKAYEFLHWFENCPYEEEE